MSVLQAHSYALDPTWHRLLCDLGIVPADMLRRAGLPEDLFRKPGLRLPSRDFYRLWEGIEAASEGAPLSLQICAMARSENLSPPLFAALCSPNLLVAAQRMARYKRLVAPVRFEVATKDGMVEVEFNWLDTPLSPPASLVLMEMLFFVTLGRLGTGTRIRPIGITTTTLPSSLTPYETYLGTRVTRGARHSITFSQTDATLCFLTSNPSLWAVFEPALRQQLADLDAPATTAQRVRSALLEELPSGLATIEAIALKLALSTRTLQRRMEAEGTSYQRLLRDARKALACHYLLKTDLPAAEISFLLGFEEPNSFYRAFRAWTGTTPDRLRQALPIIANPRSLAFSQPGQSVAS